MSLLVIAASEISFFNCSALLDLSLKCTEMFGVWLLQLAFNFALSSSYHFMKQLFRLNHLLSILFGHTMCSLASQLLLFRAPSTFSVMVLRLLKHTTIQCNSFNSAFGFRKFCFDCFCFLLFAFCFVCLFVFF